MAKASGGTRTVSSANAAASRTIGDESLKPLWGGKWSEYTKSEIDIQKAIIAKGFKSDGGLDTDVYKEIKGSNAVFQLYVNEDKTLDATVFLPKGEVKESDSIYKNKYKQYDLGSNIKFNSKNIGEKIDTILQKTKAFEGLNIKTIEDFKEAKKHIKDWFSK